MKALECDLIGDRIVSEMRILRPNLNIRYIAPRFDEFQAGLIGVIWPNGRRLAWFVTDKTKKFLVMKQFACAMGRYDNRYIAFILDTWHQVGCFKYWVKYKIGITKYG